MSRKILKELLEKKYGSLHKYSMKVYGKRMSGGDLETLNSDKPIGNISLAKITQYADDLDMTVDQLSRATGYIRKGE